MNFIKSPLQIVCLAQFNSRHIHTVNLLNARTISIHTIRHTMREYQRIDVQPSEDIFEKGQRIVDDSKHILHSTRFVIGRMITRLVLLVIVYVLAVRALAVLALHYPQTVHFVEDLQTINTDMANATTRIQVAQPYLDETTALSTEARVDSCCLGYLWAVYMAGCVNQNTSGCPALSATPPPQCQQYAGQCVAPPP